MKKLIIISLALVSMFTSANAQLLYKISGKDLKSPSYIVGTYHLAPVSFINAIEGIMKVLHIDRNLHTAMTENELRTYVEVSHEDGVIESEEREMIYNLFDFSDAVAKDIMIPRIDMARLL